MYLRNLVYIQVVPETLEPSLQLAAAVLAQVCVVLWLFSNHDSVGFSGASFLQSVIVAKSWLITE